VKYFLCKTENNQSNQEIKTITRYAGGHALVSSLLPFYIVTVDCLTLEDGVDKLS
jgi:hypothetical protein